MRWMIVACAVVLGVSAVVPAGGGADAQSANAHGANAPVAGERPLVIAHRGASGYLPEHTLPAYALAYGMGADVLEPDVVLTRDGVPICLHDIHLERVTDVESVFPDRARNDGRWYAIDFTLEEIRRLSVDGPSGRFAKRVDGFPSAGVGRGFRVATLDEMLGLVRVMNEQTGREVGVIPEAKAPGFHRAEGRPIEGPLLEMLASYGYTDRDDGAIVQCFEAGSLRRMRDEHGTRLRLVFLAGNAGAIERAGGVDGIAAFADGVGPARGVIESAGGPAFMEAARRAGLTVWAWTYGRDAGPIRRAFAELGVDGVFCDYPDVAIGVRDRPSGG